MKRSAVGLRPLRAGALVFDAEPAAGERVRDAAVAGAVVADHAFDGDPVAPVEGDGAAKGGSRGRGLLIGQHLGVGEAAVVVDSDVHELVADGTSLQPVLVREGSVVVLGAAADTPAGAADDPAAFIDVDVHELAWP